MNLRTTFAEMCCRVAEEDDRLFVLLGDIGHGSFVDFRSRFHSRYLNVGILEQAMVSLGAGLSRVGFIPVLHTIAPFMLERAFEQLKLDFAYHRLSGNLVFVGGTFDYSNLGCTHHCYSDLAHTKAIENSEFFNCGSHQEFKFHFDNSYNNDRLSFFRLNASVHDHTWPQEQLDRGFGIVGDPTSKKFIVTTSGLLSNVLQAFPDLRCNNGENVSILSIHCPHPFNPTFYLEVVPNGAEVFVIEDHFRAGCIADDFFRLTSVKDMTVRELNLGSTYMREYGSVMDLQRLAGLDPTGIASWVTMHS